MKSIYDPRYETVIRYLRDYRERNKLTQSDLSKALGKHRAYVNKYESGSRRLDLLEMMDVFDELGVSVYEIMKAIRGDTDEALMEHDPFIHGFSRGYLLGKGHDLPGGITTKVVGIFNKKKPSE